MEEKVRGTLVIIGGAEDKKGDCTILARVVELAGKEKGRIAILTLATEEPEKTGALYKELFKKLGMKEIVPIHIYDREDTKNQNKIENIQNASCIFFTGGDQLKITSLLGGTEIESVLRNKYEEGVVIAGTSAGASVMSETMITSGNNDDAPRKCTLKMAPGLGLLKDVVIDQHFAQRGRIGRLLTAIAQNPHMLGIGIDEDTSIVIRPDSIFEVYGSNAVTIIDGEGLSYTNVSELNPDEILAITDIKVHVLSSGFKYDINLRQPLIGR